jgi:predicted DNA-binding transcriptional regulator AlpA
MTHPMSEIAPPPWADVPATGPILRPDDAAKYIGLSTPHYYDQAARGVLPKPIKIGLRASGVPQPWLDAVIAHCAARAEASV